MSAVRIARSIGFALAAVILAVSGIYVVIDLARWEWNRAELSAIVCVAALVVLVGMILFRQLYRIEQRMEALERPRRDEAGTLGALRSANGASAGRRFRWLDRPPDRLGVFIPVLLGAGVLLSLVAYLIERIAGVFAAAALDPRTARELAPDLPLGSGMPRDQLDLPTHQPVRHRAMTAAIVIVTVVLSLAAVEALRVLTQTRPDEVTAAGTTSIVLDIDQRRHFRPLPIVAADLWGACRSRLPGADHVVITQLNEEHVQLDFDRSLGRTGRVRIVGCFQDHTLDLVRADVISIESRPAGSG